MCLWLRAPLLIKPGVYFQIHVLCDHGLFFPHFNKQITLGWFNGYYNIMFLYFRVILTMVYYFTRHRMFIYLHMGWFHYFTPTSLTNTNHIFLLVFLFVQTLPNKHPLSFTNQIMVPFVVVSQTSNALLAWFVQFHKT